MEYIKNLDFNKPEKNLTMIRILSKLRYYLTLL